MHLLPSGISITLPQTKNIALNPHKIDTKNTYQRTYETCVCKLNVRKSKILKRKRTRRCRARAAASYPSSTMTEHYFLTITASYLHQTVKKENQKKEKERQTNKPYDMIATMRRESKLVANTVTILPSFLLLLLLSL